MAISQIDKLQVVREAKRIASSGKQALTQQVTHLTTAFPDMKASIDAQFAATFNEFDALSARCTTLLASISVTNADRAAFGTAYETEYRTVP